MTRRVKRKREETAGTVDIPRSPSSSNFLEGDSKGQSDMLSRVGEMIRPKRFRILHQHPTRIRVIHPNDSENIQKTKPCSNIHCKNKDGRIFHLRGTQIKIDLEKSRDRERKEIFSTRFFNRTGLLSRYLHFVRDIAWHVLFFHHGFL